MIFVEIIVHIVCIRIDRNDFSYLSDAIAHNLDKSGRLWFVLFPTISVTVIAIIFMFMNGFHLDQAYYALDYCHFATECMPMDNICALGTNCQNLDLITTPGVLPADKSLYSALSPLPPFFDHVCKLYHLNTTTSKEELSNIYGWTSFKSN